MTGLVVLSVGATLWTLFLIVTANVAQLHGVAERLAWCTGVVTRHRDSFSPVGVVALGAVTAAFIATIRMRVRQRRQRAGSDNRELAVITSDEPVAYALPGRPGQIVVSTGMLRSLDPQERKVLIAHERSHLQRHHHRYVRITELAVAAIPILTPLNARLRFAVERWADEDAADEIGDRALVASAIARAALASQRTLPLGLGIADASVLERVEIMLEAPSGRSPLIEGAFTFVIAAGTCGLIASLVLTAPIALAVLQLCN